MANLIYDPVTDSNGNTFSVGDVCVPKYSKSPDCDSDEISCFFKLQDRFYAYSKNRRWADFLENIRHHSAHLAILK